MTVINARNSFSDEDTNKLETELDKIKKTWHEHFICNQES